jgi:hypothetical protein
MGKVDFKFEAEQKQTFQLLFKSLGIRFNGFGYELLVMMFNQA